MHKCYDTMIDRIKKLLTQVPGSTLEMALEGAVLLMCPDGAIHTALGKSKNSIITYLMILVSRYIIVVLNQLPSSGNNILVHCQIHGKESIANLK